MAKPNTKIPTDKTVRRDFETGTVQPGPGMAPDQPPAEDMKDPGAAEDFGDASKKNEKEAKGSQQSSCGNCGCG